MSYRPSTNPPRTAWARHLDQVMRERGWSRVRLFEEIGGEMGYGPKSRTAILPILEGKEPTSEQVAVLARHFGEPPESETPLVSAPPDLATALLALAEELRLAREERAAMVERLAETDAVLRDLVARTSAIEAAHVARPHSAGSGR